MRPFTTSSLGSVTISDPVEVDYRQNGFNIGLHLDVTGTNTSSVQFSADNPNAEYATDYNTDATWIDTATAAATADASISLTIPCRAVRLNMTAYTSGSAKLTVVQGSSV